MKLKALNLAQRFGCEIALTTVGTHHNGNIFYYQEVFSLAVGSGHPAKACAFLSTNVSHQCSPSCPCGIYTVRTTSFPVGLTLAITSTSPPGYRQPTTPQILRINRS